MKLAGLIALIVLCVTFSPAQNKRTPEFTSYPVAVERARAKSINFRSNPDARTFRTRLSEALRAGVNFAGHYVIAAWGCGTGCLSGAVIDTRDGRVFFPAQLAGIAVGYSANESDDPIAFRKNSRLVVISGIPGNSSGDTPEKPGGKYYYEWKNGRFRLVKFIEAATN